MSKSAIIECRNNDEALRQLARIKAEGYMGKPIAHGYVETSEVVITVSDPPETPGK